MYLYIKALHVFAVVVFLSGSLALAATLSARATRGGSCSDQFVKDVLRWDAFMTTPALAVVWVAGMSMAFGNGWDRAPWLMAKLIPVTVLSGLHSTMALALKGRLNGLSRIRSLVKVGPAVILATFAIITWLAVTKPF